MVKIATRRFKAIEGTLKAASDDALKIAIPIKKHNHPNNSWSVVGEDAARTTEQRWLGRMIVNTLHEVRARADLEDTTPDYKEQSQLFHKQEIKMVETKKRKREEVIDLEKQLEATRKRVLAQVESHCADGLTGLRPSTRSSVDETTGKPSPTSLLRESGILENVSTLHDRAKQFVERLDEKSQNISEGITSLKKSTAAVTSFLQNKPSRVEQAIRRGIADSAAEEEAEEEEGASAAMENSDGPTPEASSTSASDHDGRSGISCLSDHLAPA